MTTPIFFYLFDLNNYQFGDVTYQFGFGDYQLGVIIYQFGKMFRKFERLCLSFRYQFGVNLSIRYIKKESTKLEEYSIVGIDDRGI